MLQPNGYCPQAHSKQEIRTSGQLLQGAVLQPYGYCPQATASKNCAPLGSSYRGLCCSPTGTDHRVTGKHAHLSAREGEEDVAPCLPLGVGAVVVRQAAVRRLQTAQSLLAPFGYGQRPSRRWHLPCV